MLLHGRRIDHAEKVSRLFSSEDIQQTFNAWSSSAENDRCTFGLIKYFTIDTDRGVENCHHMPESGSALETQDTPTCVSSPMCATDA